MKIVEFKIYRYNLMFKNKMTFGELSIENREGLIIKLTADSESFGFGEVAPLPSFSEESLDDTVTQLFEIRDSVIDKKMSSDIESLTEPFYPSVRFGLESALLNISAHSKGLGLSSLVNNHSSPLVLVNGLLSGDTDTVLNRAESLLSAGFDSFKLKIGRGGFDQDIESIEQLRKLIGKKRILRLDANRSFSLGTFQTLVKECTHFDIEYFEEPLKQKEELTQYLSNSSNQVIALDESLSENILADLDNFIGIKAFVLKPTLHGFMKTMTLVRSALENNIMPVISSSYESAFGILTLASMAAIINSNRYEIPVGLGTLDSFENNLITDEIIIENGKIDLRKFPSPSEMIDFEKLIEVNDE